FEQGAATQAFHAAQRDLDLGRVERALADAHPRRAAARQPETALRVAEAGVAAAVPDDALDAKLRLFVAHAAEVSGHDVRAADDDLADFPRRAFLRLKFGRGQVRTRRAEAVAQHGAADLRADVAAGQKPFLLRRRQHLV